MTASIAFVFPGQGSQSLGMLADIAPHYPQVSEYFTRASQVLRYDLWQVTQEDVHHQLNQTAFTQPAILAASYAIWDILTSHGIYPNQLAGHSLGEYTALTCAGAFSFEDAIKLVSARGCYMQEAIDADSGAMAAILGLSDDEVVHLCQEIVMDSHDVLAPANYNSPGQVVIAGHKVAVLQAIDLAKSKGAKMAVLLPVSVPSHCSLMQVASERLKPLLAQTSIQLPNLPIINNSDVASYQTIDEIRYGLIKQLYFPVRWVETIEALQTNGINTIIECGPGKVLSGLNKRINKQLICQSTHNLAALEAVLNNKE